MVAIVRTEWSGTTGGPGLTQMAALGGSGFTNANAQGLVNAVRKFWDDQKAHLPDELRLLVMPTVDVYSDATGELTASYVAGSPPAVVAGTSTAAYTGGAGYKITWNTGVIRNGRRVRGSTFVVPAASTVFTANGTVGGAPVGVVEAAAAGLMLAMSSAGGPLVVWSRPLVVDGVITRPGASAGVLSGSVGSKSALLRGRRD